MSTSPVAAESSPKKPLFTNLDADDSVASEITVVDSLCLNCGKDGKTRILLTKIPFYKELIITSFSCDHCGESNNQTQFGGQLQEKGLTIKLLVKNEQDLNRQVVVSDYASVMIPDLEFEIEPRSRNGEVTTIEGILERIVTNLDTTHQRLLETNPKEADKIKECIGRLDNFRNLSNPFHFVIQDPSGNSFIENPNAPQKDKSMEIIRYKRSENEDELFGILPGSGDAEEKHKPLTEENITEEGKYFEYHFPLENHKLDIPHFKEAIIMATICSTCGHRSNEVKAGSGIEPKGIKITLTVNDPMDLTRDILKSETCSICIPELEFEIGAGTLGGRFTTLEGLLLNIREQLLADNPIITGDSANGNVSQKLREFIVKFDELCTCKRKVKVIFDDPAGNSYVQNFYAPDEDPALETVHYERSFDQNEELGLNHMKTENY